MNKSLVLARMSKAYDVVNDLTLTAKLVSKDVGEQTLAKQHITDCLVKGDLWPFDRVYLAYDLFKDLWGGFTRSERWLSSAPPFVRSSQNEFGHNCEVC
jgi:hypothetical protein